MRGKCRNASARFSAVMDRVLKRVGLSKRSPSEAKPQDDNPVNDDSVKVRRRRRSKSRRRSTQDIKKSRGLFNIDWVSVKDCKSCKSRAITKRFCSKRSDNELYRSNSFKFERFIRGNDDASTLEKKIALCDDYSLPADHLSKRRPNSIAVPSLLDWNPTTPNEEKIEILETYSNPRDSKQPILSPEDEKCFTSPTSPDREYSQPYTTEGSSEPTSDEEFFGHQISAVTKPPELNSPDSITEGVLLHPIVQSPIKAKEKRHPSPYYCGDLFKDKTDVFTPTPKCNNRSQSLGKPLAEKPFQVLTTKSYNQKTKSTQKKYRKCASLDNPSLKPIRARSHSQFKQSKKASSVDSQSTDASNEVVMPPNRFSSPCACITPEDGLEDEMTRQRHLYETAFDSRITKSDDDLDQIDRVSNHPVLIQLNNARELRAALASRSNTSHDKRVPSKSKDDNNIETLSQNLQNMHLPEKETSTSDVVALPLRGFALSPPSTAPLPTKFHEKELIMNSIRSAPNLPKSRLKDLHLPIKSLRGRSPASSSGSAFDIEFGNANLISEFKGRPGQSSEVKNKDRIQEIKDRPRKDLLLFKRSKENGKDILEYRGPRRRHKYSSTESMTTSSSGGSMESIKSSTSEGNRSTSSSESRHSSSLSSHDSDSAANYPSLPTSGFLQHHNKLHILSPISDKSSQEPISETSDNNKNNNSQKCSPEEIATPENVKTKRPRLPQNKNLLNLGFHIGNAEIQGSDSGISIQSREGLKSRFGFTSVEITVPSHPDFSDLPFDMPKLRRRRLASQEACTSGSATSVDLRDLPFDMPKLRRRLRTQQPELSILQASSSQSVIETDRQASAFKPKLTLNLGEMGNRQRCAGMGLSLGLGLNIQNNQNQTDGIDVSVPLEKQGWFHGAITRIEAENVLRVLKEGSFLVRNSESTHQDYSLSLKSARGFMHMRIQKDGAGECFILGQFSKPFTTIPEMINHYSINRLPIRGAEHMCLIQPVIAQLL